MLDEVFVSVVIPTWRDEEPLTRTLQHIRPAPEVEVIVACALGDECRHGRHREGHPTVRWVSAPRGRAAQMNAGALIARGRWLLFLHADSELPPDWLDVLIEADRRRSTVAGAFRLAIDSRAWQARVIEAAVRLRIALFGLPYGDQALFVRRHIFEDVGGYADLPLMEDVDVVRRLKARGKMMHSSSAVLTSARRWERDGWFRRSGRNLCLATQFLLGVSPARLARAYFRRRSTAVVVMARAPWTGGKTRLGVVADDTSHAELRCALFLDTLDAVTAVSGVEHMVACEPADASERMCDLVGPAIDVIAQRGRDLGERLTHVFEDVFRLGCETVVVVGSDLPDLPCRLVEDAVMRLREGTEQVVLGPAADGGYYLVGLNKPCPALFERIDWSTERVLEQTRSAAIAAGQNVTLLDQWADVDEEGDLKRFIQRSSKGPATRTRAWACEHLRTGT